MPDTIRPPPPEAVTDNRSLGRSRSNPPPAQLGSKAAGCAYPPSGSGSDPRGGTPRSRPSPEAAVDSESALSLQEGAEQVELRRGEIELLPVEKGLMGIHITGDGTGPEDSSARLRRGSWILLRMALTLKTSSRGLKGLVR